MYTVIIILYGETIYSIKYSPAIRYVTAYNKIPGFAIYFLVQGDNRINIISIRNRVYFNFAAFAGKQQKYCKQKI